MPLFKDFRRRSKAIFSSAQSSSASTNGTVDARPENSSSTLDSPTPSLHSSNFHTSNNENSSQHLPTLSKLNGNGCTPEVAAPQVTPPQRPVPIGAQSSRSSGINGSPITPTNSARVPPPASPYAPRVESISENSWVHQNILLISGETGYAHKHSLDGTLTIYHPHDSFPPTTWPVFESHFKALVHLTPGPNRLRLDFTCSKLPNPLAHTSWININYLPLINAPPLQLAIVLGSDSDGHYDAVPERVSREGNDLDSAIRKFRMAAYLWQSFTGEQMYRNQFGRRCFRFEEEWQVGTLSARDTKTEQMRNEARVHIIRCNKTVEELRSLSMLEQDDASSNDSELFNVVHDAISRYFGPQRGHMQYVSALLLDTHWDKRTQTITGHTAVGSDKNGIKLALFGSYALQSYPSTLEEVVPAFSDCTRTDTNFVANYQNECGSSWEAANSGIARHLREVGRLFGCLDEESGIMGCDYAPLNRSFTVREPYSTRTKSQGLRLCLADDEAFWHRLDILRFRFHPCFRLPRDPPLTSENSIQVWPVDNDKTIIASPAGIAFIEIFVEGDEICRSYIEYLDGDTGSNAGPKQVTITESEIRHRVKTKKSKQIRLVIHSGGLSTHTVDDISELKTKCSVIKLPNGQSGYRGRKVGHSPLPGSSFEQLFLECSFIQTKLLVSVKTYHNDFVYGLEFCYEDSTSQIFGNKKAGAKCSEFVFDTRRGEILMGFCVKAGPLIDGIEIITNLSRKSGVFGNGYGKSGHRLIPPLGYSVAGVAGSVRGHIEEFSLIITR
ncbi:hypothetical protein AJ79_02391 [Helicocarpus griseus UAMH5409]|uniref:Jacalin-type lectin domain-containing protein n=1 Tax=Helicocarpus griseus UAMH5409 TaxID=1447875 RepID=A0A2B7Y2J8_9EURO|nr:hypothetical protein AJ79_02391 [Helicocarpus griseus UAMH5409]